jgi:hypothetical protein
VKDFTGHTLLVADDELLESTFDPEWQFCQELMLGSANETPQEYAARRDACRDILAEYPELAALALSAAADAIATAVAVAEPMARPRREAVAAR